MLFLFALMKSFICDRLRPVSL